MLEYCERRFEFHKKEWAHVSAEAKDLIAGLLVKVRLCDLSHVVHCGTYHTLLDS